MTTTFTKPLGWGALLALLLSLGCDAPEPERPAYTVDGAQILHHDTPYAPRGVNVMQTFGLIDQERLDDWEVAIVREFIGNLREQPLSGGAIQGADGQWLHALARIVDQNRAHGRVTILCPFGWVDEQGVQTLLTGLNPRAQPFYGVYMARLEALAKQFAGQPDVWVEVWNEPYHWDNANGYSHELWRDDMLAMVGRLRGVPGFDNIIVVPGCEQGQSEAAILQYGATLLEAYSDIVFDLHAYEKWHRETATQQRERLLTLQAAEIPVLIGEVGVFNAGHLRDAAPFLSVVEDLGVPTLGWLWKQDTGYPNALMHDDGSPNVHQNHNWGSIFQTFLRGE